MGNRISLVKILTEGLRDRVLTEGSQHTFTDREIKEAIDSAVETRIDSLDIEDENIVDQDTLKDLYITVYQKNFNTQYNLYDYTTFIEDLDQDTFLNSDDETIIKMFTDDYEPEPLPEE